MNASLVASLRCCTAIRAIAALAGTGAAQVLVRDIRPGSSTSNAGSDPGPIWNAGPVAIFVSDDGLHCAEPWRTDGSAGGTSIIADIRPGSDGSFFSLMHAIDTRGLVFFLGDDGSSGIDLWSRQRDVRVRPGRRARRHCGRDQLVAQLRSHPAR